MPPAPHVGQSAGLQSMMLAGLKSMTLWLMLTFSVFHRQPSHQSSGGEPVIWPANVVVLIDADGRLALQVARVNGPDVPPSTRVHTLSDPSEQKRFESSQRKTLPLLLTMTFPLITDCAGYERWSEHEGSAQA